MTLPEPGIKRPSFLYNNKPSIKRPEFDKSKPQEQKKRTPVIRGAGGNRCYGCGALLHHDDSVCTACGRTQIDISLLNEDSLWKKRIKYLGEPTHGYNGT